MRAERGMVKYFLQSSELCSVFVLPARGLPRLNHKLSPVTEYLKVKGRGNMDIKVMTSHFIGDYGHRGGHFRGP